MRQLASAALLVALFWTMASAQAHRASIRGFVKDPSGQRMSGVDVRVTNEETRESRHVRTDHNGRFTVAEIPPGIYRLTMDHRGYGRFVARTEVAMNQDYWLDVSLQNGDRIQAVDVVAPFLPSDHDTAALHTFITHRDLNEWPIDSGNFLEVALLAPETSAAPQGSSTSRHGRFAMNVNGARDQFTNFVLDGVYNVDPGSNTPAVRPPSEGIRQFQVLTSNYDASFGRTGGGQISAVTKSGTNSFFGSIYGFARGTALGGRNHFAPKDGPAPEYARHQLGATLGGPLVRNRTFFFFDYERTHVREGITRVTNVPTLLERTGDFSQSPVKPIDYLTGERFPGDVIPANRITGFGREAASLYPAPNRNSPFANYVSSPAMRDDINQADVRVDQSLGNTARIVARYSIMDQRLFEPFDGRGGALIPGFGARSPLRAQNAAVSVTHAPSSALVNDVRFGYNRLSHRTLAERSTGPPLLAATGYSPIGRDGEDRESTTDTVQISDTAMFSHGHHTVRVGGEWYGVERRTLAGSGPRSFVAFTDQNPAGNALANLLLGLPAGSGGTPMRYPPTLRTSTAALFLQNDWRPVSTFSLSAGLRYEYATPAYDPGHRAEIYDPATGRLVRAGTAGVPRGGYAADSDNIAPRAGFAWTVGADRMNVIRGGYGMYYSQPALETGLLAPDPPNVLDVFPALSLVFIPPSAVGYQGDLKTSRLDTWNINFQHQLGQTRAFEFAYVGSRGHNLLAGRDINQPPATPRRPNPRPNPLFADITMLESRATSAYDGFHIRFQQRPSTGTSMIVSYTIGKSRDDASGFLPTAGDPNFPQNSLDVGAERARSSFDIRHRFAGAITRPLPFNEGQILGKLGFISRALADSDLEAVATFQTGRPFTVAILPGIDNSNTGSSRFGFGANDRPNVDGSAALPRGTESAWFKTSVYSMPPFGSFGNSGRNSQTGPGYKSVDAAIVKHIRLGTRDRATIDLRLEAFNLLGTVNYDLPDAYFGSPTFGRILSAGSPRRVQFGIKAIF